MGIKAPERTIDLGADLRQFLEALQRHHPDDVLTVSREVDPVFEATAILTRLEQEGRWPVVVFERVRGSDIPCVTNVHASFPRLAMALGLASGGVHGR